MADTLPTRVVGGLRPSLEINWTRDDGTPEDLTGAGMTGTLKDREGTERPIAGTLSVLDGPAGTFEWQFAAGDLAQPGTFRVQFTAAFVASPTPAKSFWLDMTVGE